MTSRRPAFQQVSDGVWIGTGDLFASRSHTLVNAVNCVGVMGAGIAAQFRRRYPAMFRAYQQACADGTLALGRPWLWTPPADATDGRLVLNVATKQHWRDVSDIGPITTALSQVAERQRSGEWDLRTIAMPALGCGLGSLDFDETAPLLIAAAQEIGVPVAIFRPHR